MPTWATSSAGSRSTGGVGQYTSLALDGSGNPRIIYCDLTYRDLKYAYSNDGGVTWPAATRTAIYTSWSAGRSEVSKY
jgi:hypothetical protein